MMKKNIALVTSLMLNGILLVMIFVKQPPATDHKVDDDLPEKTEKTKSVNIVMLGNSITHAGDWQKVLQRDDVLNAGKPGWTTQQLSWIIKDFVTPYRPKLCFFKAGINDYTLGISTHRIFKNICHNLDAIKKVGTNPVYTTTLYQRGNTYRNQQIDSLNERVKQYCIEKSYDFVDLRPFLCKDGDIEDAYVQEDNTHLKPEAYPQWAKAIQPIIAKYGL